MKKKVIVTVLAVVCVVQAGVIAHVLLSPGLRYRRTQTELDLNRVLCNQIQSGDTQESVSKHLGPGIPAVKERHYVARAAHHAKFPKSYPDGIDDSDTLLLYPNREWTELWLQFRKGKLINHIPESYKTK